MPDRTERCRYEIPSLKSLYLNVNEADAEKMLSALQSKFFAGRPNCIYPTTYYHYRRVVSRRMPSITYIIHVRRAMRETYVLYFIIIDKFSFDILLKP